MIIGIDASNLRKGGGVTHLYELLRAADPAKHNFEKIVIWSEKKTLDKIDERSWIIKAEEPSISRLLPYRMFWQLFRLKKHAKKMGCNVLFVPGGSDSSGFKPLITMSRNMLPFEWKELFSFGFTFITFKLILLRFVQIRTFRKTDGLIFLSNYARTKVTKYTGPLPGKVITIPHGIGQRFFIPPRPQRESSAFTVKNPCRILYVSIIDPYKHQLESVRAVSMLISEGLKVHLDLIGPPGHSLNDLLAEIENNKLTTSITYHGEIPHEKLHEFYARADIGLFASSCENMPNILLEGMAASLPMVCSNSGPMQEILKDAGVYFNPKNEVEIANALRKVYFSAFSRTEMSAKAFKIANSFSWQRCADETFKFLNSFI